jgi:glycosyltransferase involved in cell wall biosynthesis
VNEDSTRSIAVFNHVDKLSPRITRELQTLTSEGYDVTVYHWDRGSASVQIADPPWTERRLGTRASVGRLGAVLNLPWLYLRLLIIIWRHDMDIVHLTHLMFLPLAPVLARGFGVAIVYDSYEFHALDLSLRFPELIQPWMERTIRAVENSLVAEVDCVLTIDSVDGRLAERYRHVCRNVAVLYNVPAVTSERPAAPDGPNNGDATEAGDEYRLVYVGGISREKGAIRAIETVRLLRDDGYPAVLQFIGTVQGGESWFQRGIRRAGLTDAVEFTEWLPYEEMLSHIVEADVALALHQPTERFQRVSLGNGQKFFTYMEAGLPIVAPSFGEVACAVTEADCGVLVDTTDTESVATAVATLLDAPDWRTEMGARGRRMVENRFNWDSEGKKLITAYERMEPRDER